MPEGHTGLAASLGADPLRADADVEAAWRRFHDYVGALGAALLDQSVASPPGA